MMPKKTKVALPGMPKEQAKIMQREMMGSKARSKPIPMRGAIKMRRRGVM